MANVGTDSSEDNVGGQSAYEMGDEADEKGAEQEFEIRVHAIDMGTDYIGSIEMGKCIENCENRNQSKVDLPLAILQTSHTFRTIRRSTLGWTANPYNT
jgi:hypothetical protein